MKDKTLTISKKAVLKCAEECEDFKRIAKKLWPDEIKSRENIIDEIRFDISSGAGLIELSHGVFHVAHISNLCNINEEYEIEFTDGCLTGVYKK